MIHLEFKSEDFKSLEISSHGAEKCADIANQKIEQFVKDRNWLVDDLEKTKDKLYAAIERLRTRNFELEKKMAEASLVYSNTGEVWLPKSDGLIAKYTAKIIDKKKV